MGLVLLLLVGVAPTTMAQTADARTADTAIELTSAAPQSGNLVGSTAGAYAYYWIDYPGGSVDATITYYFSPTDAPLERSFGINVWEGPRRLAFIAGSGETKGTHKVVFFSANKQRLLVQVTNYLQSREAFYQLTLTGIEPPPGAALAAPAPATTTATTPTTSEPQVRASGDGATPDKAIAFTDSATGSLVGDSAGAYVHYWIENRTGRTATFQLDFSPSDSTTTRAVSVEVYQGNTQLANMNGGGSPDKGTLKTFFTSQQAGPILVKVGNYRSGVQVGYKLLLTWS